MPEYGCRQTSQFCCSSVWLNSHPKQWLKCLHGSTITSVRSVLQRGHSTTSQLTGSYREKRPIRCRIVGSSSSDIVKLTLKILREVWYT